MGQVIISRWIAEPVRRSVANEWPPDVLELFGSWKPEDFPDAADLRAHGAKLTSDNTRETAGPVTGK